MLQECLLWCPVFLTWCMACLLQCLECHQGNSFTNFWFNSNFTIQCFVCRDNTIMELTEMQFYCSSLSISVSNFLWVSAFCSMMPMGGMMPPMMPGIPPGELCLHFRNNHWTYITQRTKFDKCDHVNTSDSGSGSSYSSPTPHTPKARNSSHGPSPCSHSTSRTSGPASCHQTSLPQCSTGGHCNPTNTHAVTSLDICLKEMLLFS